MGLVICLCLQLTDIQIEEIFKNVCFLISLLFSQQKNYWDTLITLPSVLLVACHQSEIIIDANSQPGCGLLSIVELSSQHSAIYYKFIQSYTNKPP